MKSFPRIYLAGPMRGIEQFNFPAFESAASHLRSYGYEVISPHELDIAQGQDPRVVGELPLKEYMARDLPAVCHSDLVVVLPGWERSEGTLLELHVARVVGVPWLEYEEIR